MAAEGSSSEVPVPNRDAAPAVHDEVLLRLNSHVRCLAGKIATVSAGFGVRRLALFGSATEVSADVVPRDLDITVRFDPSDSRSRGDLYFGLKAALEAATGMPVDLLESDAVDNPYLLKELVQTEVVLYEAT